jgi:polar amino acid transport system substrate-binding protein
MRFAKPMRLRGRTLLVVVPLVVLTGCLSAPRLPATGVPRPTATTSSAASTAPCSDANDSPNVLKTYSPSTTETTVDAIRRRGQLVAGVSADTKQLGAVAPGNPADFEGFDIDIVMKIAAKIWPGLSDKDLKTHVQFKVIRTADRTDQLNHLDEKTGIAIPGAGVDIVVRAFTITCGRWQLIAFSAPYLMAQQRLMVRKEIIPTNSPDPLTALAKAVSTETVKAKVCAPKGSTSFDPIKSRSDLAQAPADTHTDCLALLQQGKVDAIIGDDAILAGLATQDPYSRVVTTELKGGAVQPYGIGVNAKQKDLVGFVNGVLETMHTDGSWTQSYKNWLSDALGATGSSATQPTPNYSRG